MNILLNTNYANLLEQKVGALNNALADCFEYDKAVECLLLHYKLKQKREQCDLFPNDPNLLRIFQTEIERLEKSVKLTASEEVELWQMRQRLKQGCLHPQYEYDEEVIAMLERKLIWLKLKSSLYNDQLLKVKNDIKIFYLEDDIENIKKHLQMKKNNSIKINMGEPDKDYVTRKLEKSKKLISLLEQKRDALKKRTNFTTDLDRINNEIEIIELDAEIEAKQMFYKIYKNKTLEQAVEAKLTEANNKKKNK